MTMKGKAVATHIVPAVALYSAVATIIFRGTSQFAFDFKALSTTAVMSLLCALAQDFVPRATKEALVFWRFKDRLPGCRAFMVERTDRYDLGRIANLEQLKNLPGDRQQRVFYSIYKKHQNDGSVAHYSARYIAWRDTATVYFLLALLSAPVLHLMVDLKVQRNLEQPGWLTAFSLLGYLLTLGAARQSANGLVGQVLSCETAGQPHAINI